MSLAGSTSTLWTTRSLIVMPRMSLARAAASSGSGGSLTPPALPRPPALTCALTITRPPMASAAARASSGVVATLPTGTGTPYEPNSSLAWCSNRSTQTASSLLAHAHPCPARTGEGRSHTVGEPIGSPLSRAGRDVGNEVADGTHDRCLVGDHGPTDAVETERPAVAAQPAPAEQVPPVLAADQATGLDLASTAGTLAVDIVDLEDEPPVQRLANGPLDLLVDVLVAPTEEQDGRNDGVGGEGWLWLRHASRSTSGLGQFRPPRPPTRGRTG